MRLFELFYTCFEGEPVAGEPVAGEPVAGEPVAGEPVAGEGDGRTFSQDDVNRFLADDRRKHTQQYKKLEENYQSLLQDNSIASELKVKYEEDLEALRGQWRTKEQQAEYDKKKQKELYEKELKEFKVKATDYEQKYTDYVITDSIRKAAGPDAFNSDQIVDLLKPRTQFRELTDDEGKPTGKTAPMVELQDIDEQSGEIITTLRTPSDAVRRMKEIPKMYGNLFHANVVSGVGSGAATGGVPSGTTKVDLSKLSTEQYMKIRKENPDLLGLKVK